MSLRKSLTLGASVIAVSLGLAVSAQASTVLPVTNLTFNAFSGTFNGKPKNFFTQVMPTGWSIGAAAQIDNLIYVGNQGSETYSSSNTGNIYGVYSNPGFSNTVPLGTNFYQADGNPQFESTIMQTIPNLTAGTTYTLQFQRRPGSNKDLPAPPPRSGKCFLAWVASASTARQIHAPLPARPIMRRKIRPR